MVQFETDGSFMQVTVIPTSFTHSNSDVFGFCFVHSFSCCFVESLLHSLFDAFLPSFNIFVRPSVRSASHAFIHHPFLHPSGRTCAHSSIQPYFNTDNDLYLPAYIHTYICKSKQLEPADHEGVDQWISRSTSYYHRMFGFGYSVQVAFVTSIATSPMTEAKSSQAHCEKKKKKKTRSSKTKHKPCSP